ncbi:OmpA family protein [bacterium SCSIO 12741]|nr:OmpA family protein [bacterium SCSIO 12741]
MNVINRLLPISLLALILWVPGKAQNQSYFADAKTGILKRNLQDAYRKNDYYTQIDILEELLKRKPEKVNWQFKLARAYDESRNYQPAMDHYSKTYYADPKKYAVCLFHMGRIMKTREQYQMAGVYFDRFIKEYREQKDSKYYRNWAKAELGGIELAMAEDTSKRQANVVPLAGNINKAHIEFSPVILDSTTFWYTSLPSDTIVYRYENTLDPPEVPLQQVFLAQKQGQEWENAGLAPIPLNELGDNIGSLALSPDKQRLYFTRCSYNWQRKISCKLYVCHMEGGQWGEPELLDGQINLDNYTSTHPTVGPSSKPDRDVIYFTSDRPGGKGGNDIWYFRYRISKNKYEKPRNCGNKVNTPQDEITPHFDVPSHRLYFSSEGRQSIGGFDVFYTVGERSKWLGKAENAGTQLNSPLDDLYYMLFDDRETGLLVSNRDGSIALKHPHCCDDLFYVQWKNLIRLAIEGEITDKKDNKLAGVELVLYSQDSIDGEELILNRVTADENGNFNVRLEENIDYRIQFEKEGYFSEEVKVSTIGKTESDTLFRNVKLARIPDEEIIIPNILYDFDDASLTSQAKTAIDTSIYQILIHNPQIIVEISSHTDSKGTHAYNEHLSQQRAESVVKYLRSKGIDKERMQPKGYGETQPIAPNVFTDGSDNPAGRAKNRRTAFRVIGQMPVDVEYEDF